MPINIVPGEPLPLPRISPTSPITSTELDLLCESPLAPEVVDQAAPNTWPRRFNSQRLVFPKRPPTPSVVSQCSTRASEISYGVLDYYLRGPSLDLPPPTPRLDTPIIDPGLEKFDFGLPPITPLPPSANGRGLQEVVLDASARAETAHRYPNVAPPQLVRSQVPSKNTYRLFPITKDTTPPSTSSATKDAPSSQDNTPSSKITFVPSHSQPDPSYRPRRESLSSSIRSRKDSFNSFCGTKRIPTRVLSEGSTTNTERSTDSTSAGSPPERSRWSDDTITSPVVATTPGPRTSFGSLLGHDSSQYPACFFEDDDDEAVPLRRKFPWKRSTSLTQEQRARRETIVGERRSVSARLKSAVLCAGCCSGED
jgi:Wiskott-Aldrich syndrome protein